MCSTLILTWILHRVESGYIWDQEMVSDSRSYTSDAVLDLQELHILISGLRYWFWPIKRKFLSVTLSLGAETTIHVFNFISKDAHLILILWKHVKCKKGLVGSDKWRKKFCLGCEPLLSTFTVVELGIIRITSVPSVPVAVIFFLAFGSTKCFNYNLKFD